MKNAADHNEGLVSPEKPDKANGTRDDNISESSVNSMETYTEELDVESHHKSAATSLNALEDDNGMLYYYGACEIFQRGRRERRRGRGGEGESERREGGLETCGLK